MEEPTDEKMRREISATISAMKETRAKLFKTSELNIERIRLLIAGAEHGGMTKINDDLLRSAVVFLHATIEEFLRGIGAVYLSHASERSFEGIPFHGRGKDRSGKITLAQLLAHRGKTVEEVIALSIAQHLDERSFSSPENIAGLLESVGIPIDEQMKDHLTEMAPIIKRRHQIVHRADVPPGETKPQSISSSEVRQWVSAVEEFEMTLVNFDMQKTGKWKKLDQDP